MAQQLAVIGVPSGAGACGVGQDETPAAIRRAGLIESLGDVGFEVCDLGDSPVVPWRPDRARPQAQNLDDVVEVVRSTAQRVADALSRRGRMVPSRGAFARSESERLQEPSRRSATSPSRTSISIPT